MWSDDPRFAEAKCRNLFTDDFFPERGSAQITARRAKAVCNGDDDGRVCPVRGLCLDEAIARREKYGVWGGMSERERQRETKRRRAAELERDLLQAQARARRQRAARLGWERRRAALDKAAQSDHATAKVVALGSKTRSKRATTEAPARRRATA